MKMELDFEDDVLNRMTRDGLKHFIKKLMSASDAEEQKLLSKMKGPARNDLADLDEEMHGKPNTPEVEDDEIEDGEELPEVPKKGKK
jgi:hypothetical protein